VTLVSDVGSQADGEQESQPDAPLPSLRRPVEAPGRLAREQGDRDPEAVAALVDGALAVLSFLLGIICSWDPNSPMLKCPPLQAVTE